MSYNKQLARIFKDMSSIYQYMGGKQKFRAIAYAKAANVLDNLQHDISTYVNNNTLDEVPCIGESMAEKIKEYISTGHIKKYEALKNRMPAELLEMMDITGFGPQTIKHIHQSLNIQNKEELVEALQSGRVSKLKGFGEKKVQNLMRSLKLHHAVEERMLLWDALQLGNKILDELKHLKEVDKIELAGSLRRKKETIGDIDILIAAKKSNWKKIIAHFTSLPFVTQVIAKGETKASVIIEEINKQADVRIVHPEEWGAALLYFTGSKNHNVHLRTIAKSKGYKISEYGLFDAHTNKFICGETEADVYKKLGFDWIEPEMREDKGELELAAEKNLPQLISLNDMRGDMHMHSKWSDGAMDIDELAALVLKNFSYDYIVLTDHSKSERVAGGMNEEEFLAQIEEIKKVNKKLQKDFIKTGCEVDILQNGKLDLKDNLLERLDWVCASIHSGMNHDNTERLIAACEHPLVCCVGHPAGRIIGKREAYPVDWKKVFETAKKTGTAFEINAQKDRLDLNDELARMAREAGVMLTISTDSHLKENFSFMELGVAVARSAWCTRENILNTKSWKDVQHFMERKRNRMLKYA
ncbi:MAG TPA: DNA polymerase/3'-5' exonuclease PolX [Parafilimonas sp.]|nr:DNA polymerase/3'-5' exonuclease PolX [Parafilimonas sp.]